MAVVSANGNSLAGTLQLHRGQEHFHKRVPACKGKRFVGVEMCIRSIYRRGKNERKEGFFV